mmetsp:Transcript_123245/g.356043  ORF Transcript_123245/g.356043 Transcript_123245/m.356043 type:complete len:187 (-) Transcript_123245:254-814(-)|eukprot:CAMPEP_0176072252 /NCGR_PEP_ID=MMETSP0120_2-20121206/36094_1 /TAXON_ID=160619 /ORGANISM="Kryptoperidinium foliaceum, Strain CCMP 1326" /LENGTH=186 /DNA_ID=CAMNT_0017405921 /DNA_START=68 /DNA_END=628 /DNA_ORIENTATION=+
MAGLQGVMAGYAQQPAPFPGGATAPQFAGMPPMAAGPPGGAPVPTQPLTMIAPASAFSGEAGRYAWYRVAFVGGVDLRHGPSVEAPRTGEMLCQNATFAAAEELMGADGRVYLRLADGRGWAFDDSSLFPHDPSVVRGFWQPVSVAPPQGQQQQQPQPGGPMLGAGARPYGSMPGLGMDTRVPAWG